MPSGSRNAFDDGVSHMFHGLFRSIICNYRLRSLIFFSVAWMATYGYRQPSATNWASAADQATPLSPEAYAVLKCFYDYDTKVPLETRVVDIVESEEAIRRKIVFRGARGYLVPAYLEIPRRGAAPYPLIVLLHGWSGSKEHWWTDDNYISGGNVRRALLAAGFAIFAADAQGHGDRIAENDYQVVNLRTEPEYAPRSNFFSLRDVIVQTTLDTRRGIDYLQTRTDIDMNRLGLLGYSMGGFEGFVLSATEPRVKAAVACVVPVSWRPDLVLDPKSYALGVRDARLLMLMGKRDELCDEAEAQELYSLIRSPSNRLVVMDSDHRLPAEYVTSAVDWLKEHLAPAPRP